jgi:hypothetical protein
MIEADLQLSLLLQCSRDFVDMLRQMHPGVCCSWTSKLQGRFVAKSPLKTCGVGGDDSNLGQVSRANRFLSGSKSGSPEMSYMEFLTLGGDSD